MRRSTLPSAISRRIQAIPLASSCCYTPRQGLFFERASNAIEESEWPQMRLSQACRLSASTTPLPRAASLVVSSLGFIHDRGTPLDMDQYSRLFGTSRIPTDVRLVPPLTPYSTFFVQRGFRREVHSESRHIVVLR